MGVTVIVPMIGVDPVLAARNDMFPVPLAPNPILVLSFVQAYVVVPDPVFVVAKFTVPVDPLQKNLGPGEVTCPKGLIVIVN